MALAANIPRGEYITMILRDRSRCCAPRLAETPFRDVIRRRVTTMTIETTERTGIGLGRGGRMSRKRKRDAVLRLLRGEDLVWAQVRA